MRTASDLSHGFDHHPPHHPVSIGLFTAGSAYEHVGCLVRECKPCGGQAVSDVYAAWIPHIDMIDPFPLVGAEPRCATSSRSQWFVCAECSDFGFLSTRALEEALGARLKRPA